MSNEVYQQLEQSTVKEPATALAAGDAQEMYKALRELRDGPHSSSSQLSQFPDTDTLLRQISTDNRDYQQNIASSSNDAAIPGFANNTKLELPDILKQSLAISDNKSVQDFSPGATASQDDLTRRGVDPSKVYNDLQLNGLSNRPDLDPASLEQSRILTDISRTNKSDLGSLETASIAASLSENSKVDRAGIQIAMAAQDAARAAKAHPESINDDDSLTKILNDPFFNNQIFKNQLEQNPNMQKNDLIIENRNETDNEKDLESERTIENDPISELLKPFDSEEAADVISDRGDLGNDFRRGQFSEMFANAYQNGGAEAVVKLADEINNRLKAQGRNERVLANTGISMNENGQMQEEIQLDVLRGNRQVDELRIQIRKEQ